MTDCNATAASGRTNPLNRFANVAGCSEHGVLSIMLSMNRVRHLLPWRDVASRKPLKTSGWTTDDAVRLTTEGSYEAQVGDSRPSTPTANQQVEHPSAEPAAGTMHR